MTSSPNKPSSDWFLKVPAATFGKVLKLRLGPTSPKRGRKWYVTHWISLGTCSFRSFHCIFPTVLLQPAWSAQSKVIRVAPPLDAARTGIKRRPLTLPGVHPDQRKPRTSQGQKPLSGRSAWVFPFRFGCDIAQVQIMASGFAIQMQESRAGYSRRDCALQLWTATPITATAYDSNENDDQ